MKWVVGSVAALVALVIGIAIGWKLRGGEVAYYQHLLAPSRSPSPPGSFLPLRPIATVAPMTTAKPQHAPWAEDTETFAWPTSASDDVVVVDATHYLVKRAYVVKVTSTSELTASMRIIPAVVDGGVVGVKVFGIRAGSASAKLGLKNGDLLKTLNGVSLASPEDALEADAHVRDGKNFVLSIERAGTPLDIHYHVLD